jgi:short-subunit dehydrogenase
LQDVTAAGATGCLAVADVADPAALLAAIATIEAELGAIDVWVNGVGVSAYGRFLDLTEQDYLRVNQVTYLGTVHGTHVILPRMMARGGGSIVNIGSAVAKRAVPLQSAYSAAKFAVFGFTEALRAELRHEGSPVQLSIVHPPSTNTPCFEHAANRLADGVPCPPPPVYAPELTAEAIELAVTRRLAEVKVGGCPIPAVKAGCHRASHRLTLGSYRRRGLGTLPGWRQHTTRGAKRPSLRDKPWLRSQEA